MAWNQVRVFNKSKGGTTNGYCLQNVRLGYGINSKYPNAIGAWNKTQQHRDRNIPTNVDAPLYYTYKSDGHINVRLADGRIWNDGTIFANLDTYLKNRPQVTYLGWGESVNDVRVIEWKQDNTLGTVYLKPHVKSWAVYSLNTPLPVNRKNAVAFLNPNKFGGLSYPLLAKLSLIHI